MALFINVFSWGLMENLNRNILKKQNIKTMEKKTNEKNMRFTEDRQDSVNKNNGTCGQEIKFMFT